MTFWILVSPSYSSGVLPMYYSPLIKLSSFYYLPCLFASIIAPLLLHIDKTCVRDVFSESQLNNDTRIIRTR